MISVPYTLQTPKYSQSHQAGHQDDLRLVRIIIVRGGDGRGGRIKKYETNDGGPMILERGWFIRTRGGGGVTHLIMVYDGKIQIYTTGTGEYDALDTVLYFAWVVACFGCCALLVAVAVLVPVRQFVRQRHTDDHSSDRYRVRPKSDENG